MQAAETYVRLALKAQAQCRATLETLATIKNPPVVYARQANIAAGRQQVNNGPGSRPWLSPMPSQAVIAVGLALWSARYSAAVNKS